MGDRNNPIKFGPEWLRNLAQERSAASSTSQSQVNSNINCTGSGEPGASGGNGGAIGGTPGSPCSVTSTTGSANVAANTSNSTGATAKIQLAKQRYGREEMLALYDRTSEAPPELKYIDFLYQPRGKPPFALNNSFEDEMDTGPSMERFATGRGQGRGLPVADRGRPRLSFVRSPSTGRGSHWPSWHLGGGGNPRMSFNPDDEPPQRPWSSSNGGGPNNRNSGEQPEWTPNKMYRSKRQGQTTNWRQSREEGEEWRSSTDGPPSSGTGRSRSNQDKWAERDWGERPTSDKSQNRNNRRTWVGSDSQNDELPEWAVDNAEACGGTFDASGAFHGYSNDDTNVPKAQEPYPLTRSHTHGSFVRSKTVEEGSDEWWASEKAKKLSPKRFDASDIKFKKPATTIQDSSPMHSTLDNMEMHDSNEKHDGTPAETPEVSAITSEEDVFKKNALKAKFTESKTFDSLMRTNINLEEANDERGNFQSVMITPNNSLRQKHQNIVASVAEPTRMQSHRPGLLKLLGNKPSSKYSETDYDNMNASTEEKIVEDLIDMTLEDKEIIQITKMSTAPPNQMMNQPVMSTGMPSVNSMPQMPNTSMQMRLTSPIHSNQGLMQKANMQSALQGPGMQPGIQQGLQQSGLQKSGLQQSGLQQPGLQQPGLQQSGLQQSGLQQPGLQQPGLQQPGLQSGLQQPGLQSGLQPSSLQQTALQQASLQQSGLQQSALQQSALQQSALQQVALQQAGLQQSGLQPSALQQAALQQSGLQQQGLPQSIQQSGLQPGLQQVGITNSALNASLGLPIRPLGTSMGPTMGMRMQGVPPHMMPNSPMSNPGLNSTLPAGLQNNTQGIPGFQPAALPSMASNMANNSLFMNQNTNNNPLQNHGNQSNMFPMHGLQHSGSQPSFASIYGNIMQTPPPPPPTTQNQAEMWYYEDPKKTIQGPFSSKEMLNWYRAGFFTQNLMVRRACDTTMRPLGSYGPVVPFAQVDILSSFPMSTTYEPLNQGPRDTILNSQPGLGLESVDSLWSPPTPAPDMMWMQQAINPRNENCVNNLSIYFWDEQPSTIASSSLLPEDITKEMKTEDQILAQIRSTQNISTQPNMSFMKETPPAPVVAQKTEEVFPPENVTPNLEELQKLIKKDILAPKAAIEPSVQNKEPEEIFQQKSEKAVKAEQAPEPAVKPQQVQKVSESKASKQAKNESEKARMKENLAKAKAKKVKDEKKEDEPKREEEVTKPEKRSVESSPIKNKKEEKTNKKELEKEKKEWLKEGFTIVKGHEKNNNKENKKKVDEAKVNEEMERKKKEEEKLVAAEEEKKRKQLEAIKKQQEQQQLQQKQATESAIKKAPWSLASNQSIQTTNKEGLTLSEIQRLEREKKLEQMKEQQQMMQIIAQQQALQLQREQEMQAGLGWAKKKANNLNTPGQSLAEIQAEARKQASTAAVPPVVDEAPAAPPPVNNVPWGNSHNGAAGGFWDTQPNTSPKAEKPQEPKPDTSKPKKKITIPTPVKKETSPAAEFEVWCSTVLNSWSSKIDVPTFIGFLKDIESPYEVKDYVKCYLGETKDSSDFARQFLERRSKLLRVGMVTPSDDLCSPAIAVNPRTISGSDYQEVKGKGKKTKKNKMLKVDARILGFSVTAAEDRINVGDIDTV